MSGKIIEMPTSITVVNIRLIQTLLGMGQTTQIIAKLSLNYSSTGSAGSPGSG